MTDNFSLPLQLASLAKHADDYAKLAEAEQFMFEVSMINLSL